MIRGSVTVTAYFRAVDTDWMREGACRGAEPQLMFPIEGAGVDRAKRVCEGCPVQEPCLEYALLTRQDHGVWGGASERQRRRMRAQHLTVIPVEIGVAASDRRCVDCGAEVHRARMGRPRARCEECRTAKSA